MKVVTLSLFVLLLSGCQIHLAWNGFSVGCQTSERQFENGVYVERSDFFGFDAKWAPDWTVSEMWWWIKDKFSSEE